MYNLYPVHRLAHIIILYISLLYSGYGLPPDTQLSKINKLFNIRESTKARFEIEIDGGINEQTSKKSIANGADVLVAGSYIYEGDESEYENLINSIR